MAFNLNRLPRLGAAIGAACLFVSALHALESDVRNPVVPVATNAAAASEKDGKDLEKKDPDAPVFSPADADIVEAPVDSKKNDASVRRSPQASVQPLPPIDAQPKLQIDADIDTDLIQEKLQAAKAKQAAAAAVPQAPDSTSRTQPKPLENIAPAPLPDVRLSPVKPALEPGYASVLGGTLQANTELNAEALPHLIRGVLVIPSNITLKIGAGAVVHMRADANAAKPLQAGAPDPTKSAALWIFGTLIIAGENGRPVEIAGLDKVNANLLFYGSEQSRLEGVRFKASDVAQNGGVCQWTNCEFNDSKYYALAAGAGQFTHCTFKKCGGIFAAYDEGPWALLVRRCQFENCRDGVLLNRDPGPGCLIVEKNNFIDTRGANLRAMPRASGSNSKTGEELLIGDNWYGTTDEDEIDRRIVDRRIDPAIKAHLNTRPPAEKPYANAGAGAPKSAIATALQDQQKASAKMLEALAAKQKAAADKAKLAADAKKRN